MNTLLCTGMNVKIKSIPEVEGVVQWIFNSKTGARVLLKDGSYLTTSLDNLEIIDNEPKEISFKEFLRAEATKEIKNILRDKYPLRTMPERTTPGRKSFTMPEQVTLTTKFTDDLERFITSQAKLRHKTPWEIIKLLDKYLGHKSTTNKGHDLAEKLQATFKL